MYRLHFGLRHAPLGKECNDLWNNDQIDDIERQFNWLLKSPGLGLLTAEPGLGKTAALRRLSKKLNPHEYKVIYVCETDFGRLDFYRQLASKLNIASSYRRAQLWRDLKDHITHLATQKNILLILIIDEAQNLPPEFLRDFPSFLNFVFDSKDYMMVWLVGHPELERIIDRANNTALSSRIQARCQIQPINDRAAFRELLLHGLAEAGCQNTLLSDTGVELLRMASKGNTRVLHQLLVKSLQIATDKALNHLPDDVVKEAIEKLKKG